MPTQHVEAEVLNSREQTGVNKRAVIIFRCICIVAFAYGDSFFGEYCPGDVSGGYYPGDYVLISIFEMKGISQKENSDCVDRCSSTTNNWWRIVVCKNDTICRCDQS